MKYISLMLMRRLVLTSLNKSADESCHVHRVQLGGAGDAERHRAGFLRHVLTPAV